MSSPYDSALEELVKQRGLIDSAIAVLEQLRGGPVTVPAVERRKVVTPPKLERRKVQTVANGDGSDILALIKKAGGSMKPGVLADQLDIDMATLRKRTQPMAVSGELVISGTTMSRRISLPGRAPKEAP